MILKISGLDLDLQDQIGLQTSTVFKKNGTVYITPSNLNCTLIIYWFQAEWWRGGGRHLCFGGKKRPSLVCTCKNSQSAYCSCLFQSSFLVCISVCL